MPQQVTHKGKTYTEYTQQELEAIRNELLTQYYIKRGGKHTRNTDLVHRIHDGRSKRRGLE